MDNFFQVSDSLLRGGTQAELEQALLGKEVTEYGFMSMGSAKGQGFSGEIVLNIFAPKGTKMAYIEPFSYYGAQMHDPKGHLFGMNWDGQLKQTGFGRELETILQQGTKFRVVKVERTPYGSLYVDLDIIEQGTPQRWKK